MGASRRWCSGARATRSVRQLQHGVKVVHGRVVWGLPDMEEEDSRP
jgi:hypothetical protein